jgi:energy-coupling factor transporter ATP-binding protein EcfA2
MAGRTIAVEGSAVGALASWANGQDGWVRAVTSTVLARRTALDDDAIGLAVHQLMAEKGLSGATPTPTPTIGITEAPADDAPPLRLLRIAENRNVNRLVDGQEIAFNDRMTVVYGENASGKTGYARVLKQAAGSRSAARVLPDVYTSSPGTPTATIDYSLGSDRESYPWRDGAPPVPAFGRMCVFDAPAAPLHVDDDLQYLYTPADIALFEYVHEALSRVRELLNAERLQRAPKGNPFLSRLRRGTPQFAIVESLRASTDIGALRRLAEPVAEEDDRVTTLRDRVRNLENAGQQVQLAGARATQSLCVSAMALADRLLGFDAAKYESAIRDVAAREKRVRDVSEALFADDDLPGVFSAEWTAFITAGHQYGVAHVGSTFPDGTDECPYCRQGLNDRSRELIQKYRTYLVDDSQASLRTARQSLAALVGDVVDMPLPVEPAANGNGDGGPVTAPVTRVLALALRHRKRLSERQPWDIDADIGQLREDRRLLDEQRDAAARSVRDLSTEVSQRETQLADARAALLEVEDRRALRSLLDAVVEHVEAAKWVDLADTVLRTFQGLLRGVTDAMKDATRGILNSAFESAFQRECQLLNCPSVRLEFPGRQAATLRHKSVGANHRLGEVLSEGEQKVIALADCLAELSMRPSSAPIILDDPITSLDARRTDEVAERVVNLSADQQVIVFTHHLYFASKLLDAFDQSSRRSQCSFYEVLAEDNKVGLVLRGLHPRMDTVKAFTGRITKTLQDAQAASGTVRSDLIATAYGHMRGWIEAFIEDELLQGSVKRHRANISIDALSRVSGIAVDESVRILQPIFDRACERMWPHAHTTDQLQARPTIGEAEGDWKTLKTVADAVKDGAFPIMV